MKMENELICNNDYTITINPSYEFGFDVTIIDCFYDKIVLNNVTIRISNINVLLDYIYDKIVEYEKENNIRFY